MAHYYFGKVINLTPHVLNVRGKGDQMVEIPPSGQIARVAEEIKFRYSVVANNAEFGVVGKVFGHITGLPEVLQTDTMYVVSGQLLAAIKVERDGPYRSCYDTEDGIPALFVSPGSLIRDEHGKVIGCDGFTE